MSYWAGIDYSTHAIDVCLIDEDTGYVTFQNLPLEGADAFARTRCVRHQWHNSILPDRFEDVVSVGIEEPAGQQRGVMARVQGAVLACMDPQLLVVPFGPTAWRKQVGLSGSATKTAVRWWAIDKLLSIPPETQRSEYRRATAELSQDAFDAYAIALAVSKRVERAPTIGG